MPAPLVAAAGLARVFDGGEVRALADVSLEVQPGDYVSLVGPSGCGKSTLLQLIGALDRPDAGELRWRGEPYGAIRDLAGFRARKLGFVFQAFHLLPTLTALENVELPMIGGGRAAAARRARADLLLEAMGVAHRRDKRPPQLSGGERQRVAIARALANEPELLLADEPTGSLDSASAAQVMALLQTLHEERGLTLLVVTHDAQVAARAARTVAMKDGCIVADTAAA